jgi:hypothetical protein
MSLETQRGSSETERDLKEPRRNQRSPPPTSTNAAPFGLVTGRAPVAAVCHGAFESTSIGEKELRLAKAWEACGLMKGYGHLRFLFMGLAKRSWPEIVAHIPRNLGSGETPLTEPSLGHLGFKLSHIRFDWLKSGCVAVRLLFGFDTVWPELPNGSFRDCSSK